MSDAIIDIREMTFAYPGGFLAIDRLSLHVKEGERVGLVGPNGAGKTTLFLTLCGVLRATSGSPRVAGLDPGLAANRRAVAERVGIVFQNSDDQLFNATVFDDVAFGPLNLGLSPAEVRARVVEALAEVGLAGFEERVPFHLSGGEKRRAALAGVLAMRPRLLLLDEPSQYLDPRGRRELINLMNRLPATRLIASHDLDMVLDTCDRVIVLDRGRVVADGKPPALLADTTLMEAHGLEVPYRLAGGPGQGGRQSG